MVLDKGNLLHLIDKMEESNTSFDVNQPENLHLPWKEKWS